MPFTLTPIATPAHTHLPVGERWRRLLELGREELRDLLLGSLARAPAAAGAAQLVSG